MKQDYVTLYEQANEIRTKQIQDINNQLVHRSVMVIKWLGSKLPIVLHGISELLRPLFSWNPQPPRSHSH
jgi:hypothetical protein